MFVLVPGLVGTLFSLFWQLYMRPILHLYYTDDFDSQDSSDNYLILSITEPDEGMLKRGRVQAALHLYYLGWFKLACFI